MNSKQFYNNMVLSAGIAATGLVARLIGDDLNLSDAIPYYFNGEFYDNCRYFLNDLIYGGYQTNLGEGLKNFVSDIATVGGSLASIGSGAMAGLLNAVENGGDGE